VVPWFERGLLHVGAVGGYGRNRGRGIRFCLIRLRAGHIAFLDQRGIADGITLRACRHRLVPGELSARLVENGDVRTRIDLE